MFIFFIVSDKTLIQRHATATQEASAAEAEIKSLAEESGGMLNSLHCLSSLIPMSLTTL